MIRRQTRQLEVNGRHVAVEVGPGDTLLETLRGQLELTGAKLACGRGECGACTVLLEDRPRMACVTLTATVDTPITTVEGLAEDGAELGEAFADVGGLQCGFCTPGQVVHGVSLIRQGISDRETIRKQMSGNICRCTGYTGIIAAISDVAARRRAEQARG